MTHARALLAAGLIALSGPALAQTQDHPGMAMGGAPGQADSPAGKAMMDGMAKMNRDMEGAPMTGNADRDFVAMMIPHHAGAIDMAQVELKYGRDPELRRLARAIVAAQDKEIGRMRAWQAAHPGS